jgi:hypothetical protein
VLQFRLQCVLQFGLEVLLLLHQLALLWFSILHCAGML